MKKIMITIIITILLFILSGCGYGVKQGTVVDKKFTAEHTTFTYSAYKIGSVSVTTPVRHHYNDTWSIKIQKEENGKIKECWVNITQEEYNQLQIGDFYVEENVEK